MSEERQGYGRAEPRRETRLPFSSELYRAPTKDEFRTVTQLLGLTGKQVADLVGAEDARTVRRWIGGERDIPYSVWRVLLIDAGLALPDPGEPAHRELREQARAELGKERDDARLAEALELVRIAADVQWAFAEDVKLEEEWRERAARLLGGKSSRYEPTASDWFCEPEGNEPCAECGAPPGRHAHDCSSIVSLGVVR